MFPAWSKSDWFSPCPTATGHVAAKMLTGISMCPTGEGTSHSSSFTFTKQYRIT